MLVLPRSCQSDEVLVANLGKITVCDNQESFKGFMERGSTNNSLDLNETIIYFIDVRNINLFSLNTSKRKILGMKTLPKANEMYSCHEDAVPILHDTALLFQCIYESRTTAVDNNWDVNNTLMVSAYPHLIPFFRL